MKMLLAVMAALVLLGSAISSETIAPAAENRISAVPAPVTTAEAIERLERENAGLAQRVEALERRVSDLEKLVLELVKKSPDALKENDFK